MKETFDPAQPLEIESGKTPERKRNPLAQVRYVPEDPKLEQAKAAADRDDAMFAAVMRKFIEGGIVLHPNEEKPGKMQIGAGQTGEKGEDMKIGDLHLEVFDPKAKEIIKKVRDEFFGQVIEESYARPIAKREASTQEQKLESVKSLLETQQSRLRLDREKLQARLTPLEFDPLDGDRAQIAVENYDARMDAIREGLNEVQKGNIPVKIGVVDAMAASEVRAQEDLENSKYAKRPEAGKRELLKARLDTIREAVNDLPPTLAEEARQRARLQRTFSVLMDEQEASGRAPEKIGSDQLDLEYLLTKNAPPRAKFIKMLYETRHDAEEALQNTELKSKPPGHPDIVKQKQRIQLVDQLFHRIGEIDPAAVKLATRNLEDIRALAVEAQKLDLPGEILVGIEQLKEGKAPNDKFIQYVMLEQVRAEDAHNQPRVMQLANVLSTLHPDMLMKARKRAEQQRTNDLILQKINAQNAPDKPVDPFGKTLAA